METNEHNVLEEHENVENFEYSQDMPAKHHEEHSMEEQENSLDEEDPSQVKT
jgi:hypothetical protein